MDKIFDSNISAGAYGNTLNIAKAGPQSTEKNKDFSFADVLSDVGEGAINTMRQGEKVAAAAITEDADLNEVIMAVNNAEVTLQTIVAVRDKMMSAYQEIMRMPV